jgi:predicted glutamine amidotransferase
MCAIGGYFSFGKSRLAVTDLTKILRNMARYGHDATGIGWVNPEDKLVCIKGAMPAQAFIEDKAVVKELDIFKKSGVPRMMLLHTRAATRGDPSNNDNNHPIRGKNSLLIHNGWILNPEEIDPTIKRGMVDSLALSRAVDKALTTKEPAKTFAGTMSALMGIAALAALVQHEDGIIRMWVGKDNTTSLHWTYIHAIDTFIFCTDDDVIRNTRYGSNTLIHRGLVTSVGIVEFSANTLIVLGDEIEGKHKAGVQEVFGMALADGGNYFLSE